MWTISSFSILILELYDSLKILFAKISIIYLALFSVTVKYWLFDYFDCLNF